MIVNFVGLSVRTCLRTEDDAKARVLRERGNLFSHSDRLAQSDVPHLLSLGTPARTPTTDTRHHIGRHDRDLPSIMPAAKQRKAPTAE